ncbi:MAG: riboflavin biosynthesis protein RibF [Flavobacteriales bacterium MED-G15]|nr:MAG: riboflavin biosynthesis protein RibF [Flavobacteriales bacterium MED-G15]|tara:strand:- start:3398 stop:4336 length:939 start_codon:yes stop_codon:yes gene_type:complete
MQVVENIFEYQPSKASILTIGTFDGVHVGHRKIIADMVATAKKENLCTTLLTFFPHPRMVLQKDSNIKMIDTLEEKIQIFENLGVEVLIVQPFTKEFSRMTAIEFTRDILVNSLKISKLVIGYDHRFGRNREATVDDLRNFGLDYGFSVSEIPAQDIESIAVSSTKIRNAITSGAIKLANKFLSRSFNLSGTVVRGDELGRKIGYPTANLKIEEDYKLKPQNGVYLVKAKLENETYFGMMNVGVRPTVAGKNTQIETYFFDFSGDLYDQKITLELLDKIREEKKFDSLEKLKNQLDADREHCQKLIPQYYKL